MLKNAVGGLMILSLAFAILFVSILRTASVKYDFNQPPPDEEVLGVEDVNIEYYLASPGSVLPDSPLWPVKAIRDRIWLTVTTNPTREAELLLLLADKRIASSRTMFKKGNPEQGYMTMVKAEEYLRRAYDKARNNKSAGLDTNDFFDRLAMSSLKHREVIREIEKIAPADAIPNIIKTKEIPVSVYKKTVQALNEEALPVPENPFN